MATATTQKGRLLELTTPAGADALLIQGFSGFEAFSTLFSFQLTMYSERGPVAREGLLGQPVTVAVNRPSGGPRYFHGIISRIGLAGGTGNAYFYYADVVPRLWLLTRRTNCRIFQDLNVPDIAKKVLDQAGVKDYRFVLSRSYTTWDYCVQYHETDFHFVSRLLEHEGIYYFFVHERNKHTLVLADAPQAHQPVPGLAAARFEPVGGYGERGTTVTSWQEEQELMPGKYTYRDHYFQMPDKSLEEQQLSRIKVGGNEALEIYDYPGNYATLFNKPDKRSDAVEPEGRTIVKAHMEGYEAVARVMRGTSDCSSFSVGSTFELTEYPKRGARSGPFLLTAIQHALQQDSSYRSGGGGTGGYSNSFTCIPKDVPFRPARVTGKPLIMGPQTAVVVGIKGEEFTVDKFGRVKVQFFWDREGKSDQNSSCWVRVAQSIAGKRWGPSSGPVSARRWWSASWRETPTAR
jgi:type VI secretion system secreted protein VgrG